MASGFFVPGPSQLAVGFGTARALLFLGFTRDGLRVRHEALFRPVKADYAGGEMPADQLYMGELVTCTFQLARFDPTVFASLRGHFFGNTPGAITPNLIGTLMLQEGGTFPFKAKYPYQGSAAHPGYASNDPGISMPNALAVGSKDTNSTTEEQVWNITIASLCQISPSSLSGTVWNTDMTGFPAVT